MHHSVKVMLFQEGRYRLYRQPLATAGWAVCDWIGFVDRFGRWESVKSG